MPGESPMPAAVRTARRAAADRALAMAEKLEASGKSGGRQSMRSVRSQRLRSIIRGAPDVRWSLVVSSPCSKKYVRTLPERMPGQAAPRFTSWPDAT